MLSVHAPRWIVSGLLAVTIGAAYAQSPLRVRGTIADFDGSVLSVRTREGKDLKLKLAENATVTAAKAIALSDLKPGDYVGSTTRAGPDGSRIAVEVHTLAPTTPQGYTSWDLVPESMMTNGHVASVQSASDQQLTLQYQGVTQTIAVPPGTPVAANTPVDRSYLKRGEYIFTVAQVGADGTMTVQRVQVSRDGVRPPH